MKRLLPVLLGIMLVLTFAVAAETTPVQFPIDDETGAFDVTYEGTPGALYALVVVADEEGFDVENPEITEDNLQYIDQQAANSSSGVVAFEDILLKDVATKGHVYLGGTDLDEAVYLGSVAGPLSINVNVGDIIYLQNGSKVVATDTVYTLTSTAAGYVVVNSVNANGVQTAQKVYKVENSTVAEVENYNNGAVNTSVASIRVDVPAKTGIRTEAKFAITLKNNVKETGFVATVESPAFKTRMKSAGLDPNNYELTLDLMTYGAAVRGVAYDKATGVDRYADLDGLGSKIVYCVVTDSRGLNITANTVLYNVVVRPYFILEDGTTIYGEATKNTIYDVANSIKKNDPELYSQHKDYIDNILDVIKGDVIISGEDLFKPVG